MEKWQKKTVDIKGVKLYLVHDTREIRKICLDESVCDDYVEALNEMEVS